METHTEPKTFPDLHLPPSPNEFPVYPKIRAPPSLDMIYYSFTGIIIGIYLVYCWKYWNIKGIPVLSVSLKSYLVSIFFLIEGVSVANNLDMIENYREMKENGYKYAAVVTLIRGVLVLADLDIIKELLIKCYMYFDDRGFSDTDMFGPQVGDFFVLNGTKLREMQSILRPDTLCKKLESLFQSTLHIGAYLIEAIEDCTVENRDIDVKELVTCFTTDVITYHCYKVNCYSYRRSPAKFCKCQSDRLDFMGLKTAEESVLKKLYSTIRKYMVYHEQGLRKHCDFWSLESFMKNWWKDHEGQPAIFEMVDRTHTFFYQCFDVTSTTLNYAIYELGRNPEIQEKVREEINTVLTRHDGQVTWKILNEMKYLDQVIDETLRMYPPIPNLIKRCQKKGCSLDNLNITYTMDVVVPLFSLHRDPDYFPDPEKFDPDRFDEGKKDNDLPFFMPYGEGFKECRSIRACMVQTKVALVQILKTFTLSISPKTHLPLEMRPQAFLKNKYILYIKAEKI